MGSKNESIFVLGLDGGGSHTQAVILDQSGAEIGRGVGGASNHQSVGVEATAQAILKTMKSALEAAGNPSLSTACWGMAGLDRAEDEQIIQGIAKQLLPKIPVKVVHDSTIALVGGTAGKQFGVVIISGTGSIAVGYHPSGRIERAGGWGHLLGDEGSGHSIALRGLNAATRAYDGRDLETSLIDSFTRETGETSFENLASRIYLENWSTPEIASLAPVVITAAENGDEVAIRIVSSAAQELALAGKVVILKLGLENDAFDVVLSGGIFTGSQLMIDEIGKTIHSFAPAALVLLPINEPVIGAGMIALQMEV